ncbi:hypothetical protein [Pseudoalteromonas sp. MMG012]|uniref:hypothetical protein n=1 Tax=Pseudoalteromonas sp. MMG012 TaxID=2822686 RepID=UPI001B3A566C|nr:hypothetical protein [Pseudoalteromonas sp. MMG012]MBQ4849016.1 hypothetical protein [Pseudoalteromonas sp. MMG012]
MNKKYIIFAPSYDENVGGSISMHRLCHLINEKGAEAYLWHDGKSNFNKCSSFNTPEIFTDKVNDYIVVYMDVVSGNPISCPHVVRWFLNKPGFFSGKISYGVSELYFRFQDTFSHEKLPSEKLYVAYFVKHYYSKKNHENREGSCYMMRKGRGREIVHDVADSVLIDGLSHEETAMVFNKSKYFYCYDLYSAYSSFAAMCGCIPIVIPEEGLSESNWQPDTRLRYGIAYGDSESQILYAKETARNLLMLIEQLEFESEANVEKFIERTQEHFRHIKKSVHQIELESPYYFQALRESKNKVVVFGASESLRTLVFTLDSESVDWHYIVDNDPLKSGSKLFGKQVYLPQNLFCTEHEFDVLIVSIFHLEIREQLLSFSQVRNVYSVYD